MGILFPCAMHFDKNHAFGGSLFQVTYVLCGLMSQSSEDEAYLKPTDLPSLTFIYTMAYGAFMTTKCVGT